MTKDELLAIALDKSKTDKTETSGNLEEGAMRLKYAQALTAIEFRDKEIERLRSEIRRMGEDLGVINCYQWAKEMLMINPTGSGII